MGIVAIGMSARCNDPANVPTFPQKFKCCFLRPTKPPVERQWMIIIRSADQTVSWKHAMNTEVDCRTRHRKLWIGDCNGPHTNIMWGLQQRIRWNHLRKTATQDNSTSGRLHLVTRREHWRLRREITMYQGNCNRECEHITTH